MVTAIGCNPVIRGFESHPPLYVRINRMKKGFRVTTWFEKLSTSILNVIIILLIFLPFYFIAELNLFQAKILFICLFLIYNIISLFFLERRDIGMVFMKTYWEKDYPWWKLGIFAVFYTLSFATILFWVYYPFDLLVLNLLVFQLPTILLTGYTLHGLLSGKVRTVKKK